MTTTSPFWQARLNHQAMVGDLNTIFTAMRTEFRKNDEDRRVDYETLRSEHRGEFCGDDPDDQPDDNWIDGVGAVMPWNKNPWSQEAFTFDYGDLFGGLEYFGMDELGDELYDRIFIRRFNWSEDGYSEKQHEFGKKHSLWAEWWDA